MWKDIFPTPPRSFSIVQAALAGLVLGSFTTCTPGRVWRVMHRGIRRGAVAQNAPDGRGRTQPGNVCGRHVANGGVLRAGDGTAAQCPTGPGHGRTQRPSFPLPCAAPLRPAARPKAAKNGCAGGHNKSSACGFRAGPGAHNKGCGFAASTRAETLIRHAVRRPHRAGSSRAARAGYAG